MSKASRNRTTGQKPCRNRGRKQRPQAFGGAKGETSRRAGRRCLVWRQKPGAEPLGPLLFSGGGSGKGDGDFWRGFRRPGECLPVAGARGGIAVRRQRQLGRGFGLDLDIGMLGDSGSRTSAAAIWRQEFHGRRALHGGASFGAAANRAGARLGRSAAAGGFVAERLSAGGMRTPLQRTMGKNAAGLFPSADRQTWIM